MAEYHGMLVLVFSLFLRHLSSVRGPVLGWTRLLLSPWVTASVFQCFDTTFPLSRWKDADSMSGCLRSNFGSLYLIFLNFTQIIMTDLKMDKGRECNFTSQ